MKKKTICSLCGEPIKKQDDRMLTIKGELSCMSCYENRYEYASTCFCFSPTGNSTEHFSRAFGNEDGEFPEPVKEEKWIRTDAWRGYTDWTLNEGFVEVCSGWVTGMPDSSTRRKVTLADYFEKIKDRELIPPVEIWWIFGMTSNVFSTASTIVCRVEELPALQQWLEEAAGGLENIENMLS